MARTTFNGPVNSVNGFEVDGVALQVGPDPEYDSVSTGDLTTTGTVTINGTTVIISDLPTSDPSVAGQLWSNSGVLTVSAGA